MNPTLSIRSFATNSTTQVDGAGQHNGVPPEVDSDSEDDIQLYEPPQPTLDRATLFQNPPADVKSEQILNLNLLFAANANGSLDDIAASPNGDMDDIAATEEEERVIEAKQKFYISGQAQEEKPYQKPIQGDKRTYWCDLCHVELSSEKTMMSHKEGVKHVQKREKKVLEDPSLTNVNFIRPIANPPAIKKKQIMRVHEKILSSEDPVIGVEFIIEYWPETDADQEPIYECTLCGNQGTSTNANGIFSHLMGVQHRSRVFHRDRRTEYREESSKFCMEYAKKNHQNTKINLIKTIRDDIRYPWPPGTAPWSKEKGGSGIAPINSKNMIKSEVKPKLGDIKGTAIVPPAGEVPKVLNHQEANRNIALAKKICQLLGEDRMFNFSLFEKMLILKKEAGNRSSKGSQNRNYDRNSKSPTGSRFGQSSSRYNPPKRSRNTYDDNKYSSRFHNRSPSSSPHRDSGYYWSGASRDGRISRDDRMSRDDRTFRDDRTSRDDRMSRDDRTFRDDRTSRDDRMSRDFRMSRDDGMSRDFRMSRDDRTSRDDGMSRDDRMSRNIRTHTLSPSPPPRPISSYERSDKGRGESSAYMQSSSWKNQDVEEVRYRGAGPDKSSSRGYDAGRKRYRSRSRSSEERRYRRSRESRSRSREYRR